MASGFDSQLLARYSDIERIRGGEIPAPRTAILYPMYGCNLSCVGCEYAADNEAGYKRFPDDRFEDLVKELADFGVKGIEFCGGGEPTLHSRLSDVIIGGAERGLRFGLLTSGLSLSDRFLSEAAHRCSYVRVTVDAADKETYEVLRPTRTTDAWKRLSENVSRLVNASKDRNPAMQVGLKFLIGKRNAHQIPAMVRLGHEWGVSNVQFKALRLHPNELSPSEAVKVDELIAAERKKSLALHVVGSVEKLEMKRRCVLTPLQVTIDALGDVYLCCYFRHRRDRHCIGNVLETSFAELWAGPRHREAIAGIVPSECNNLDCRFVRYHDLLEAFDSEAGGAFI